MDEETEVNIIVKWSGKEYVFDEFSVHDTVAVLRHEIFKKTLVRPERQKLLNLKYKGKFAPDDIKLSELEIKPNFKIMMVGSTEQDIESACQKPTDLPEVIDDFDEPSDKEQAIHTDAIYLEKIQKRIRTYKITEINPPREGKPLLVLDIDYTLFDHRSTAETGEELMRPYLHDFLEAVYEYYDIAIWSATNIRWIEEKMRLLGVSQNPHYKIVFYIDANAMITVNIIGRGMTDIKPLGVIWGIYDQWNAQNTIMVDDIRRNFLMNPRSGLKIRAFRQAHINRHTDTELLKLAKYLRDIAVHCDDFTTLNHRKWESYKPKKPSSS